MCPERGFWKVSGKRNPIVTGREYPDSIYETSSSSSSGMQNPDDSLPYHASGILNLEANKIRKWDCDFLEEKKKKEEES